MRRRILLLICWLLSFGLACATSAAPATQPVDFPRQIAPILVRQCQSCHGPEKTKGKYRLDTLDRLRTAGASHSAPLVAGNPDQSEVYRRLTSEDEDERMPKKADRLPDSQIALIRQWIEQGGTSDGIDPATPLASLAGEDEPAPPETYRAPFPATAVALRPGGEELAVSGYHEVTVWGPMDGKLTRRLQHLPERIWGLAYSPDGSMIAVAGGTPGISGSVILRDARGVAPGRALDRIADMMLAVSFSPDGKRIAAGGADNIVRIFDVATGKRELLIEQHADWVTDVAFSPDGQKIVTASRDKSARVFDAKTGSMESAYLKHEEAVTGVCWSSDGKQVYSAGRDRKVHAWSPADAKPAGQIAGFDGDPFKVAAAAPGLLLVCSSDGFVRSYSAADRKLSVTYQQAPDWIYCLSIDAGTKRVAGGCYNGEVLLWDVEAGKIVSRFFAAPGYAAGSSSKSQ